MWSENEKMNQLLCKCGCGEYAKSGNEFIHGHNSIGIIRSDKTLEKMSNVQKGKHHSEKTKKKISEGNRGKFVSEETKQKIRLAHLGRKQSEEHKRKNSESHKGNVFSKETRRKLSESNKGRKRTRKFCKHISKILTGRKRSKEFCKKMSDIKKNQWQNPEYREKQLKAIFAGCDLKPTRPERVLESLLNELFPNEYEYVGDGSLLIGFKNPDFINIKEQKKLIELFGDYWHSKEKTGRTKKQDCLSHFSNSLYHFLFLLSFHRKYLHHWF